MAPEFHETRMGQRFYERTVSEPARRTGSTAPARALPCTGRPANGPPLLPYPKAVASRISEHTNRTDGYTYGGGRSWGLAKGHQNDFPTADTSEVLRSNAGSGRLTGVLEPLPPVRMGVLPGCG